MNIFKRWYGANPLHLLVLVASFGLAGYAAIQLFSREWIRLAVWFGGAAVIHDLLLLPIYGLADVGLRHLWRRRGTDLPTAPWINYVRLPVMISGILLLIWFPEIFRLNHPYLRSSGLSSARFLGQWLLLTGILFLASAVAYAVRLRVTSRQAA